MAGGPLRRPHVTNLLHSPFVVFYLTIDHIYLPMVNECLHCYSVVILCLTFLRLHELQLTRFLCPPLSPGVC